MSIKQPESISWLAISIMLSAALLGAVARYSYDVLHGREFKALTLLMQLLISIFAGLLTISIASYFDMDLEIAGGIAGLAGWSGAVFIKVVEDRFLKRIDKKR